MDVSKFLGWGPGQAKLEIDWLPEVSSEELDNSLKESAKSRQLVYSIIPGEFPKRFLWAIMAAAGIDEDRISSELKKQERQQLVKTIKQCQLKVESNEGFDKAEVTAGGVILKEVSPTTMESKIVKNLFIAGEILDLDGPIGGFNFQAAFSTGYVAGRAAATRE